MIYGDLYWASAWSSIVSPSEIPHSSHPYCLCQRRCHFDAPSSHPRCDCHIGISLFCLFSPMISHQCWYPYCCVCLCPPHDCHVAVLSIVSMLTSRRWKSVLVNFTTICGDSVLQSDGSSQQRWLGIMVATTKEDSNWGCTVCMVVAVKGSAWYWLAATIMHMIVGSCWGHQQLW